MDLTYPPESDAFRQRISDFLDANLPNDWTGIGSLPTAERSTFQKKWRETLRENNLLAPNWPAEYGGAGLTHLEHVILNEEFSNCLLYTSPSPRDGLLSRMPSSA